MTVPPWCTVIEALEARGLLETVRARALARHVTLEEVCGRVRTRQVVRARHDAWKALYELGFSYPEIGRLFDVGHMSVLRGVRGRR